MLKWPDRAKVAIRKLFEPLQDVDVFVEDSNDEAFYRALLNFSTDGKIRIARVFSLGGRLAVIAAAKNYDHAARRALFIVDGDFPWVRQEPQPSIAGVHCHDAYCVENLLLCENAIATIVSQERALSDEEASRILAYSDWKAEILEPMIELFAAYSVLHEVAPEIPTISIGVGNFCVQVEKKNVLDAGKVEAAKKSAIRAAQDKSDAAYVLRQYEKTKDNIRKLKDPLCAISGKDFLLPLLDFHLQSLGCKVRRKALRMRLATLGERARFGPLAASLSAAAAGAFA